MNEENQIYFIDSDELPPEALARKHALEQDPSTRTDHMAYMPGMEVLSSDIKDKVLAAMAAYDYDNYTAADVERALANERCSIEDFKALLSPAAAPYLEQMARKAELVTRNHFGNTVYIFTPLYIANYCQNYCVYCGFNCYNNIRRKKLSFEEIEHEMQVIAATGMEEILMLTGESRKYSDVHYIGEAVKSHANISATSASKSILSMWMNIAICMNAESTMSPSFRRPTIRTNMKPCICSVTSVSGRIALMRRNAP